MLADVGPVRIVRTQFEWSLDPVGDLGVNIVGETEKRTNGQSEKRATSWKKVGGFHAGFGYSGNFALESMPRDYGNQAPDLETLPSPAGPFGYTRSVRLVGKATVATNPLIEIRNGRLAKASSLRSIGLNPYPSRSRRTHYAKSVIDDFAK